MKPAELVKEIQIPKAFLKVKDPPQNLSNDSITGRPHGQIAESTYDFALFYNKHYYPVAVVAVSPLENEAKVRLDNEYLTVNKNLLFEISDKFIWQKPVPDELPIEEKDIYELERYENIELGTLFAKQFEPQVIIKHDSTLDSKILNDSLKFSTLFDEKELIEVYNYGHNKFLTNAQYLWYCLRGYEFLFNSNCYEVADDVWCYLDNERFVSQWKLNEAVNINRCIQIKGIIFEQEYCNCRNLMQLLFRSYQNAISNILENAELNCMIRDLNKEIDYYADLILDANMQSFVRKVTQEELLTCEPSAQFVYFQEVYVYLVKLVYEELLLQQSVSLQKSHRMYVYELERFLIDEHISICSIINGWFAPRNKPLEFDDIDIQIPANEQVNSKEDYDNLMKKQEFSILQDVRRKNVLLLRYLQKLEFCEQPEAEYDNFPLNVRITFMQSVSDDKDTITTSPSMEEATSEFGCYLFNVTKHLFTLNNQAFLELCEKNGYDIRDELLRLLSQECPSAKLQEEYLLEEELEHISIINEEYLSINIKELLANMQSELLLAADIIIYNFSLDDELEQIKQFYNEGFILEIKNATENFAKNNDELAELIEEEEESSIELTDFYFYKYFLQVNEDMGFVKRIDFSKLTQILEFQIQAKKAFTYLLEDQLYYYCFCIDTGELDEFFNSFNEECYGLAQKNIINILLEFSDEIIQNMRLFLMVFNSFVKNPLKFADLSAIETVFNSSSFEYFFNELFTYLLSIVEQIVRTFGLDIENQNFIELSYNLIFSLEKYEIALGRKWAGKDEDTEYEYYRKKEIQDLRDKELNCFYNSLNDIEFEDVDKIFNVLAAVHKFACIIEQELKLLSLRKFSYEQYINSLNVHIIEKAAQITNLVKKELFSGVFNEPNFLCFDVELSDNDHDKENIFEEEFINELQSAIKIEIYSENFKDDKSRCIDRYINALSVFSKNQSENEMAEFTCLCRNAILYIKELILLIYVKNEWLSCLSIHDDFLEEKGLIETLQSYYRNIELIYNIMLEYELTEFELFYENSYSVRAVNMNYLQYSLNSFMLAIIKIRNNMDDYQKFIEKENVLLNDVVVKYIEQAVAKELENYHYYYLFISLSNKNLTSNELELLSKEFGMNVEQSLIISVNDIMSSYSSYSGKLFDYCQTVNAQLVLTTNIFTHVKEIFVELNSITLAESNGFIEFGKKEFIVWLENQKIILQQYEQEYNNYSLNLLEFIRDVEESIYLMLDIYYGITLIQRITKQLCIVKDNANIIQVDFTEFEAEIIQPEVRQIIERYTGKELEKQQSCCEEGESIHEIVEHVKEVLHQRREKEEHRNIESVNILNVFEIVSINEAQKLIKHVVDKVAKSKFTFMELIMYMKTPKIENSKFNLKEFYRLAVELYDVHNRVLRAPYEYLFDKFMKTNSQNIMIDDILRQEYKIYKSDAKYNTLSAFQQLETKLQNHENHQDQMQMLENQCINKNSILLSLLCNKILYINAALDIPFPILFSPFESKINEVISRQFNFQSLYRVDRVNIEDSPTRGRIITFIQSGFEELVLLRPCEVPQSLEYCDYELMGYIAETLAFQFEYGLSLMNEGKYAEFLEMIYEAQFMVLLCCKKEKLASLKDYMQTNNLRGKQSIAIANRILELLAFEEDVFIEKNDHLTIMPFNIQCAQLYGGCATDVETKQISQIAYKAFTLILKGVSTDKSVIIIRKQDDEATIGQIHALLQRILCRRVIAVTMLNSNFEEQFQTLQRLFLSGYIVYLIGLQHLHNSNQQKVIEFVDQIQQEFGYFESIYKAQLNHLVVKNVIKQKAQIEINSINGNKELRLDEKQIDLSLDDIKLEEVSLSESKDEFGYLLFDYEYVDEQQENQFIEKFQFYYLVVLQEIEMLQRCQAINSALGVQYNMMIETMSRFNSKILRINVFLFKQICKQVSDISNKFDNASILIDYVMKSYFIKKDIIIEVNEQNDGFPNYSFRHEKQIIANQSNTRSNQYKQVVEDLVNDFSLVGNLISEYLGVNRADMKIINNQIKYFCNVIGKTKYGIRSKKSFYNEYIIEFIYGHLNQAGEKFLQQCAKTFQISIGISYDIYCVSLLLKQPIKLLLISSNFYYVHYILECIEVIFEQNGSILIIQSLDELKMLQPKSKDYLIIKASTQEELGIYSDYLQVNSEQYSNNRIIFVSNDDGEMLDSPLLHFRMTCLGEIKDTIGLKLYLVNNIVESTALQISQYYIENIEFSTDEFKSKIYRIKYLNQIFNGFSVLFQQILCRLFCLGNTYDEFSHIRSIFDFFLVRSNILEVVYTDRAQGPCGDTGESADIIASEDDIVQFESEYLPKTGISSTELLKRQSLGAFQQLPSDVVQSFYAGSRCPGADEQACFKYEFTKEYILKVFSFENVLDYIVGIASLAAAFIWNAYALFSQFYQEEVIITKRYREFVEYLKNFDLEKYNLGLESHFLKIPYDLLIYDAATNNYDLELRQQKYQVNAQITRKILNIVVNYLPEAYNIKQFSYLLLGEQGKYVWFSYAFGKGILQDINYESFLKFTKAIDRNETAGDIGLKNDDFNASQTAEEQINEFIQLQEAEKTDQRQQFLQQLGFDDIEQQREYLNQFDFDKLITNQDIQPLFGKYCCVYLDDERTALATLIACGMLSMTTFEVTGIACSGKSTLIIIAGIIVKQFVDVKQAKLNDDKSSNSSECFLQAVLQNYEVANERFDYEFLDRQDEKVNFQLDIEEYANEEYMRIEELLFENLQEFKYNHGQLEIVYSLLTDLRTNHEKYEGSNEIIKQETALHYRFLKSIRPRIQVLHIRSDGFRTDDNINYLLDEHEIFYNEQEFSGMESDIVELSGTIQLIDTTVVIETARHDQSKSYISYKMPNISISYLRQLFHYYADYYQVKMSDEWIYSFINGLNLLRGSLPSQIFKNFSFIKVLQRQMMSELPSYNSIVKENRKFSKYIDMTPEEMIQEMRPELWSLFVSNYDKLNQQYEKLSDKEFKSALKFMLQMLKATQQKPSYLQRIIALNHDELFRQINIFSLFNVLGSDNIQHQHVQQCQERISSLTLLGYLNVHDVGNALRLRHPWQQFGNKLLKQTVNAVLIQMNLIAGRQYSTLVQQQATQGNRFASKLFYFMRPLVIDQEQLLQRFPIARTLRKFARELPSQQSILFLLEQYLIRNRMKPIFDSGLICGNYYKANSFYQAHLIQQYQQQANTYEPQFAYYIYQVLVQILCVKQRNSAIFQQSLQLISQQRSSLDSVANEDMTLNYKLYFINILSQFMQQKLIFNDSSSQQSTGRNAKQIAASATMEFENSSGELSDGKANAANPTLTMFQSFSSEATKSFRVPMFEIELNSNANQNTYNSIVQYLAQISQYKLMQADQFKLAMDQMSKTDIELEQSDDEEEQSQYSKGSKVSASVNSMSIASSQNSQILQDQVLNYDSVLCNSLTEKQILYTNNIRHDRKMILDVENIVNLIESYTNKKQRSHKKQNTELNADLMSYIRNFVYEIQSLELFDDDAIEYLVIVEIIRFSILMALGIKPYLAFNNQALTKQSALHKYNNESKLIGICLHSPLQQYQPTSKFKEGPISSDCSIPGLNCLLHARLTEYSQLLKDTSILMNDVLSGNQFPDLGDEVAEFTQEPFDVILILPKSVLHKHSNENISLGDTLFQSFINNSFMNILFDAKEVETISTILSLNCNLNIEAQQPIVYQFLSLSYSIIAVNDVGKSSTLEEQQEYNDLESFNQIPNILEECNYNLQEVNIAFKNDKLEYNIVQYQFADLKHLFEISGCFIPEDNEVFSAYEQGYNYCVQEYCYISINLYEHLQNLTNRKCENFVEFTEISSNIINFISSRVNEFLDEFNYLFLVYHFFEAISSPAKHQPELLSEETAANASIKQLLESEMTSYAEGQSGKYLDFNFLPMVKKLLKSNNVELNQDFDKQLIRSTVTAQLIKNEFYTAFEYLKLEFNDFEQCAQSAYIDGIILACYLLFYQSSAVSDEATFRYLQRTKYCHLYGNCQKEILNINKAGSQEEIRNVHIFLLYLVAKCQEIGIFVDISLQKQVSNQQLSEFKKEEYSEYNPIICMNYEENSDTYLKYLQSVGHFSFPIIPLMNQIQIPILEGDPNYELLYNICFMTHVLAKTTFIIDQKLLYVAACLLEELKYYETEEREYQKLIYNTIEYNKAYSASQYEEIIKKVIILDLSTNTKDFQEQFARTISLSDNTIIFANFSKQSNINNLVILRKFLELRARKIISKRQSIYVGEQMTVTNQSLHKYKIIIGANIEELQETLEKSQMNSQEFIDQFDILASLQQENKSVYVTTEYIQESVFGNMQTNRFINESVSNSISQIHLVLENFVDLSREYIHKYVIELKENEQLTQLQIADRLNQLVSNAQSIIETSLQFKGVYSGDKVESQMMEEFLRAMEELVEAARQRSCQDGMLAFIRQYKDAKQQTHLPYAVLKSHADILITQVVQTAGKDCCEQFAIGIEFLTDTFEHLAETQTEFLCFLSDEFILELCSTLSKVANVLREDSQHEIDLYYKEQATTQEQVIIPELYPVHAVLSFNKRVLLKFLVKSLLPEILQLTMAISPDEMRYPFYLMINIVMYSFLQNNMIVKDIEDIKQFICQFLMSTLFDKTTENRFEYGEELNSIFSKKSFQFNNFTENDHIKSINNYMPEVVLLSPQLYLTWIRLCEVSYNNIINQIIPWFVKHHSVLIQFSECKNLFAAIIYYWNEYAPNFSELFGKIEINNVVILPATAEAAVEEEEFENDETDDLNEDNDIMQEELQMSKNYLIDIIAKQSNSFELTTVPEELEVPSPDCLFSVLLMCNTLQANNIDINIMFYLYLMEGYLDSQNTLNYGYILEESISCILRHGTGVTKEFQLTKFVERQRILTKFESDMHKSYQLLLSKIDQKHVYSRLGTHKPIFAEQLFELAEIMYNLQADNNRYIEEVKVLMKEDEYDPQKHYTYVQKVGPPPDSVILLFYDQYLNINQLLRFVYFECDLPIFQNIPLKFVSRINSQTLKDEVQIINLDLSDAVQMEEILYYFRIKQSIYEYYFNMPIILTIPVKHCSQEQITIETNKLNQMIELTKPYICYIEYPKSYENSLRYTYSQILMQQFFSEQFSRTYKERFTDLDFERIIAISMLRRQMNIYDDIVIEVLTDASEAGSNDVNNLVSQVASEIDIDDISASSIKCLIRPLIRSKIVKSYGEESSSDDIAEQTGQAEQEAIEEQNEPLEDTDDDWNNWDNEFDDNESQATEQELSLQSEEKEESFFTPLLLQFSLFDVGFNVSKIINADELFEKFEGNRFEHEKRKIVVVDNSNIIAYLKQEIEFKDSLLELAINTFSQIDEYFSKKLQKPLIREFFARQEVKQTLFSAFPESKELYPKLLQSYNSFLQHEVTNKQQFLLSPQQLFQQSVQQSVNIQIDAITNTRTFGIYENEWIFSTPAYYELMPELFQFLLFRESFLREVDLEKLHIFMFIEPMKKWFTVQNNELQDAADESPIYHIILKSCMLYNAYFDGTIGQVVNQSPESQAGYVSILDVYIYILEAQDAKYRISGYEAVPLVIRKERLGDVFIRNNGLQVEGNVYIGIE